MQNTAANGRVIEGRAAPTRKSLHDSKKHAMMLTTKHNQKTKEGPNPMEIPEIKNLIETQFHRLLPNDKFVDATIKPFEEWDGDQFLRIIVVYDTKNRNQLLDTDQTIALRREIHERLEKAEESRFPLIGFVVKSEAKELNLAD